MRENLTGLETIDILALAYDLSWVIDFDEEEHGNDTWSMCQAKRAKGVSVRLLKKYPGMDTISLSRNAFRNKYIFQVRPKDTRLSE